MTRASDLAELLTDELHAAADPDRAAQAKAYLKSDLEFFGESVWEIRRIAKAFVTGAPAMAHDDLVALVAALWAAPVFERDTPARMGISCSGPAARFSLDYLDELRGPLVAASRELSAKLGGREPAPPMAG